VRGEREVKVRLSFSPITKISLNPGFLGFYYLGKNHLIYLKVEFLTCTWEGFLPEDYFED
jgi:hypothetical protein